MATKTKSFRLPPNTIEQMYKICEIYTEMEKTHARDNLLDDSKISVSPAQLVQYLVAQEYKRLRDKEGYNI